LLLNVQDALFALRRDAEPFDAWRGGRELICHQARQKVNSLDHSDRATNRSSKEIAQKNPRGRLLHLMLFDRLRFRIAIVAARQNATAANARLVITC
jgi:hypothetical protein